MDKENVWCTYSEILVRHKKEQNIVICDKMDGPQGHYAKWNNSKTDKYRIISLIWAILKKKKKQGHGYREQTGGCNRLGAGRVGKMSELGVF